MYKQNETIPRGCGNETLYINEHSLKTINGESDALWPLSLLVWGGCMVPNVCHANTKKNNNPRFCELQKKNMLLLL